ncbi:thioredoxin family protein [Paeniroseomonas aquatica]|uniref:Thioredoxin domain-containing protein n=1 Tax=Paeniroseomonas aquatica TaxID=373043 RepID=A0ABT8A269_9PROT|nr:thioredoxin domain-containing protein [Paeniroseomonas aquatica]MDN3563593.1 thioredoxin domain-containing protein [Paeniroseomonas aquatica]
MDTPLQVVCPRCDAIDRVPAMRLGDGPRCGECRAALSEARFRRHLKHSGIPLLLDFWASWCGPCRALAPAFEEAARTLSPRLRLVKVSTEEAPQLAAEVAIRSIPTLALFAGGRQVARQASALPASNIVAWADANAAA